MDWPLVYQLCRQVHRWVSKSGSDKRWKHLSAKPATRWDFLMRVVKDDDVDRRQVYRQRCHSRALLIARNFGRRQAGYAKSGLLGKLLEATAWKSEKDYGIENDKENILTYINKVCFLRFNMSALFPVVIASGFHLFPFRTEKLSPTAPMVLRKRESRSPPSFQKALSTMCWESLFFIWSSVAVQMSWIISDSRGCRCIIY